ncbi:MAG: cell wall hydrolase [Acutalibacteraceae bacterium]
MKNITIIALCVVMLGVGMAEVSRTSPTAWAVEPDEPEQSTETVLQSTATVGYELTAAERDEIERVVMAEAGAEPFEGQMAVAQCILNACELESKRPDEIVTEYQYTDKRPNPTDAVKAAVSAVFDYGETVTDAEILYFYAPALCDSEWHESQEYVMTIGGHRFFEEVGK